MVVILFLVELAFGRFTGCCRFVAENGSPTLNFRLFFLPVEVGVIVLLLLVVMDDSLQGIVMLIWLELLK